MTITKKNLLWGMVGLCLFLFTACKKEQTSPFESTSDFFEKQADLQTFKVDPTAIISVTGNQGTELVIPANSIVDKQGNLITEEVTLEFIEIFSKSDMILNNKPTNLLGGGFLESTGAFYVNAKLRGEDLDLNRNYELTFPISEKVSDPSIPMSLWLGQGINEGTFTWSSSTTDSLRSVFFNLETQEYSMVFDVFDNWVNCDYRFESTAPTTEIFAQPVNLTEDLKEVYTFIVFKNINATLGMGLAGDKFQSTPIPTGLEAHIVMLGIAEEELFYGIEPITVTENINLEMTLELISVEEFKTKASALD